METVPDPLTPAKTPKIIKEHLPNGAGQLRAVLVDGHTSALTHRSIPWSPTGGYVSVAGDQTVCGGKGLGGEGEGARGFFRRGKMITHKARWSTGGVVACCAQ